MTADENRGIVETLHTMELRLSTRMTAVETKLDNWRTESERLRKADDALSATLSTLRTEFDVERQVWRDRSNRMLVGMAIVAAIAVGDLGARSLALL